MFIPDDVWRYIVFLSLPSIPPWKRRYKNVTAELYISFRQRGRPTIINSKEGILCLVRKVGVYPLQKIVRFLEYSYL